MERGGGGTSGGTGRVCEDEPDDDHEGQPERRGKLIAPNLEVVVLQEFFTKASTSLDDDARADVALRSSSCWLAGSDRRALPCRPFRPPITNEKLGESSARKATPACSRVGIPSRPWSSSALFLHPTINLLLLLVSFPTYNLVVCTSLLVKHVLLFQIALRFTRSYYPLLLFNVQPSCQLGISSSSDFT